MSINKNSLSNHFLSLVACLLRGGSGEDLRRPVINLRSARHKVEPAAGDVQLPPRISILTHSTFFFSVTNFLYERKFAKIQAGYKRIFFAKVRALYG